MTFPNTGARERSSIHSREQLDAETLEQFSAGDERESYVAARRAAGLTREAVWHQRTPDGATLAIVLLESDDVEAAFGHIVTSDGPFDRRRRRPS